MQKVQYNIGLKKFYISFEVLINIKFKSLYLKNHFYFSSTIIKLINLLIDS